jgi:hypothetical protein
VLWTFVTGFTYPTVNRNNPDGGAPCQEYTSRGVRSCVQNLESTYAPMTASWKYGAVYTYVTPLTNKWVPLPYCDPNPGRRVEFGVLPFFMVDTASGSTLAIGQANEGVLEMTQRFSASGISLLGTFGAGGVDLLLADDRVGGEAATDTGPNALLVQSSTARIVGAFTASAGKIDGTALSTSNDTSGITLRSYAAGQANLYSLRSISGGYELGTVNVTAALSGTTTTSATTLTGTALAQPKAIAYNRVTGNIDVLDWKKTGSTAKVRLFEVTPGAVATELWETASMSAEPLPSMYLSTTMNGEIVVAVSVSGNTHVLLTSKEGRPLGSFSQSGLLHRAALGTAAGITLPIAQTATSTTPNVRLDYKARTAMTFGVCGSTFWTTNASRTAGTGAALVDGPACP